MVKQKSLIESLGTQVTVPARGSPIHNDGLWAGL